MLTKACHLNPLIWCAWEDLVDLCTNREMVIRGGVYKGLGQCNRSFYIVLVEWPGIARSLDEGFLPSCWITQAVVGRRGIDVLQSPL